VATTIIIITLSRPSSRARHHAQTSVVVTALVVVMILKLMNKHYNSTAIKEDYDGILCNIGADKGNCWEINENSSHVSSNDLLPPPELDERIF
jgi:hypothetical protein